MSTTATTRKQTTAEQIAAVSAQGFPGTAAAMRDLDAWLDKMGASAEAMATDPSVLWARAKRLFGQGFRGRGLAEDQIMRQVMRKARAGALVWTC